MNEQSAREILVSLRGELEESRRVAAAAQKRTAAIEKLVEGYIELFPGLADETADIPRERKATVTLSPSRPKGQEAVLRVMAEPMNRGKFWTVAKMTDELHRREWSPDSDNPASAVRTAMIRVEQANPRVIKGSGATGTIVYYLMQDENDVPTFSGEPPQLAPGGVTGDRLRTAFPFGKDAEVASG
jgi:hypothetical protein